MIAVLGRVGYRHLRSRGSHHVLVRENPASTVVVPERREVPRGTLRAILRESGITSEQLQSLLRK